MGPSRVANSQDNSLKWADKIKGVLEFMPVLIIYKFVEIQQVAHWPRFTHLIKTAKIQP